MIDSCGLFDGIIQIDQRTNKVIDVKLRGELAFMQIDTLDDLNRFFQEMYGESICPISVDCEFAGKYYYTSQKVIDGRIVVMIQNIDTIRDILYDKTDMMYDSLTQCYLKKEIEAFVEKALEIYIRYKKEKFSVLMLDIDFFKNVNDTYGHLAGDFVLKELAALVKSSTRKADICGRFGGEEFLLLLPNTKANGALRLAQKIVSLVKSHRFSFHSNEIPLTVSIGITSASLSDSLYSLIERCDEALYRAKELGRDRVEYK